jgi:hypothetical protein
MVRAVRASNRENRDWMLLQEFSSTLDSESFARLRSAAEEAEAAVHRFQTLLTQTLPADGQPRKRSRPRAGEGGMVRGLARDYQEILGERPTTTPGGTFANVVVFTLTACRGRVPHDVSRQLRAALGSEKVTKGTTRAI